ncbi:Putative uncharacterized protein [Lacticaseibacillus paracasei]|nr:Putative uncharacterized protein [Lacticaseibacillus paracasei]
MILTKIERPAVLTQLSKKIEGV